MKKVWRVHEFAALAGVTVKALHHYDRLGLLTPARTGSGYRRYVEGDLVRVGQIVALKSVGLPLRRIKKLLEPDAPPLRALLCRQRELLEDKRRLLGRAVRALVHAEERLQSGPGDKAAILRILIEAIDMQDSIDAMRQYYSDEVWPQWRNHYEQWPSATWQALYSDIREALATNPVLDPRSEVAQSLATRWLALDESMTTLPAVRTGLRKAWADREHWPDILRQRVSALDVERATRFVSDALWERWEAERLERDRRGATAPARVGESRRRLYRDAEATLGLAPEGPKAQALVARWEALVDAETDGDETTKLEMMRARCGRHAWPPGLIRYTASLYDLDADTWLRITDFIDAARDRSAAT